jgi:hydroxymethylbilane synthase
VIGIQCRADDKGLLELLRPLDNGETRTHITAERTMLHGLQGHCDSPIAGHCATTPDGQLALHRCPDPHLSRESGRAPAG